MTAPGNWGDVVDDLIQLRILSGLTQGDVAERIGVARTTVTNWESGRFTPSVPRFFQWLEILDVYWTMSPREDR